MTTAGWIFMATAFTLIAAVTFYCYWLLLGSKDAKVHDTPSP